MNISKLSNSFSFSFEEHAIIRSKGSQYIRYFVIHYVTPTLKKIFDPENNQKYRTQKLLNPETNFTKKLHNIDTILSPSFP